MRNLVAKNDFNRSSVHTDRKKDNAPDIDEEMEDYLLSLDPTDISVTEYSRGVKDSGIVS